MPTQSANGLILLGDDDIPGLTKIRSATFGRNGSGKSTFHATIPAVDPTGEAHRVLVATVDIENFRPYTGPKHKHYKPAKVTKWDGILALYQLVEASLSTKAPVTDLVWDTWSRMQELAIGKVVGYTPEDPAKLREYVNKIPARPRDWNGWGQVGALLNEWMANFNRLPINMYYLVQENDRENRTDNYTETGPRLTPEAVRGLRDSMEIIGRMYVETDVDSPEITAAPAQDGGASFDPAQAMKGGNSNHREINPDAIEERRLFIGQHERYQTKGPTHILGRVIVNPTWEKVILPILTQQPALPAGAS